MCVMVEKCGFCTLKTLSQTQLRVWDGAGRSADKVSTMQENLQARGSELGLQRGFEISCQCGLGCESELWTTLRKRDLDAQDKIIKSFTLYEEEIWHIRTGKITEGQHGKSRMPAN